MPTFRDLLNSTSNEVIMACHNPDFPHHELDDEWLNYFRGLTMDAKPITKEEKHEQIHISEQGHSHLKNIVTEETCSLVNWQWDVVFNTAVHPDTLRDYSPARIISGTVMEMCFFGWTKEEWVAGETAMRTEMWNAFHWSESIPLGTAPEFIPLR